MRRFFKWFGVGVVALWGGLYVYPWIDTKPEQDECSFGSVSNEQYRELLAEAELLRETEWPPLSREEVRKHIDGGGRLRGVPGPDDPMRFNSRWLQDGLSNLLAERVRSLALEHPSAEAQVAAAHAVMRASGMFMSGSSVNPTTGPNAGYGAGTGYKLDMTRLGYFYPFLRWGGVSVRILVDPKAPTDAVPMIVGLPGVVRPPGIARPLGFVRPGEPTPPHMQVSVLMSEYLKGFPKKLFYFGEYGCPAIPPNAAARGGN